MIVPYVLAGVSETPNRPTPTLGTDNDDGRRTDLILPVISWLVLCLLLAAVLLHR